MAIQYANDETFKSLIKEGVVIVDFFGIDCQPCKMLERTLSELEDELPFINIVKADIDICPITAKEYDVLGIPDVYFYKDGKIAFHQVGAMDGDEIKEILGKLLY